MQRTSRTEVVPLQGDMSEHRRLPVAYMVVEGDVTEAVLDTARDEAGVELDVDVSHVEPRNGGIAVHLSEMVWPEENNLKELARLLEQHDVVIPRVEQHHNIGYPA